MSDTSLIIMIAIIVVGFASITIGLTYIYLSHIKTLEALVKSQSPEEFAQIKSIQEYNPSKEDDDDQEELLDAPNIDLQDMSADVYYDNMKRL